MPNKIADDRERVSYLEDIEVAAELNLIAKKTRTSMASLIREATHQFTRQQRGKTHLTIEMDE